uniref:Uncharacterized protein n=1 Tax=Myotis myotis TaxID=51298 RepID=A0A7J7VZ60_MYOMY|nr:hypothetical protein mMyoMyo1_012299 [Myotis myotis]
MNCVCVCVRVCAAQMYLQHKVWVEFYEEERKEMRGAEGEGRDGGRGACSLKGRGSRDTHSPHTRPQHTQPTDTQHTAQCTPHTLLTHNVTHTIHTTHIGSATVGGSAMNPWRKGGREWLRKTDRPGTKGLTQLYRQTCTHTSMGAHGRTGARVNLQYEFCM